jgi:hypothetical protein
MILYEYDTITGPDQEGRKEKDGECDDIYAEVERKGSTTTYIISFCPFHVMKFGF